VTTETNTQRIARSVTLLRVFVVASALILAVGATVLGSVLTRALRGQALDDAKTSLTQYTNGVLGPRLVAGNEVKVGPEVTALVERELAARPDILSVKVWRADGVLAWTSLAPERIGRRFPLGHHLEEVIETGAAEAELEDLGEAEDAEEARLARDHVLEVYAPIRAGDDVIGAYEIYADSSPLEESIARYKRAIWLATGGVFVALWGLLALLVRGASQTLRRQTDALRERSAALTDAYRRLEESSLDALAGLNATVEAKDPYTVGHARRVQRAAVAIGEELGLPRHDLDVLRFGALFHDIGKIAVPDLLLTKPERLSAEEYDLIKHHPAEGARIVGRFKPLRDAAPIVRHHHERWNGTGYPDGLAGDEIELVAAVTRLAEAWDAMRIERPYRRALPVDEAITEIERGRGSDFAPSVVDAFFAALRKRPAEFGLLDAEAVAAG